MTDKLVVKGTTKVVKMEKYNMIGSCLPTFQLFITIICDTRIKN